MAHFIYIYIYIYIQTKKIVFLRVFRINPRIKQFIVLELIYGFWMIIYGSFA